MDINSLLSPQESSSQSSRSTPGVVTPSVNSSAPSAVHSPPHRTFRRTRSGSARQGMTSSPLAQQVFPPAGLPEPSPPAMSPSVGPNMGGGSGTPPATDVSSAPRQQSTGMDTLADLASMQHHQPQRSAAPILRPTQSYESQLSPSTMYPNVNPVSHNTPTSRTSFDLAMSDGSREGARRDYTDTSLVPDAQRMATELFTQIQENPHSYDAHVQFVRLLHAGFVSHVYPPANPDVHGDPREYDLLKDTRTAREEMDKLFAMGEDLWAEWIQDESMLAQTVTERIAVMELCQRSVEEEYGSTKLWGIYGEWVLYLYNAATGDSGQSQWSEEDRLVGREVFTWQSVLDVWQRGAEATRWRIHDSHVVWDRLLELHLADLARSPSQEKINQMKGLFDIRLQTPHAAWDQTFQNFSSFVSTYYNANYEDIMSETVGRASEAKTRYAARQDLETRLRNATESGDRTREWTVFSEYIEWEVTRNRKRRHFSFDLVNAVYQRAVLRFPTDVNLWEDYVMFLIDESLHNHVSTSTISTLDRATRHCPWSGTLWSQYLLSSEREGQSFSKISAIKHKATSTGLLDAGGMEEVLKVHAAWCSYLRRRAFLPDATDEDLDVALVGIRSAIEDVQALGEKKYGKAYQGDPQFRLERIYIHYLSESGSWDSARETFKGLVGRRGNSYEFWVTYYEWELISWSKFVQGEATVDAARRTPAPSFATAVLKQAIKRTDLDWPEKIMQLYIAHCEDYEDSEELQLAVLETRKAMKAVNARREREARENAAWQQPAAAAAAAAPAEPVAHAEKRKREDEMYVNGLPNNKRPRPEEVVPQTTEAEPVTARRDRENATVVVKNLPHNITEHRVRQFFRHCGTINGIRMLHGEDGNSEVAIIEFDSKDEAAVAQTRDQKMIDDNTIEVQPGSGSTLFVTNFAAEADEACIRDMFRKYGEVADIRFPSLKYNTHRRFCYVQFKYASDARHALELNGSDVGKDLQLVVKISDPSQRQERKGPMHEGREIHVSNVDWKASEDDVKELFSKYGKVELVRIPRKVDGGSKGFGYVVFSSKEEANAALAMHQQEFRGRPLQVRLSSPSGAKRSATTVVSRVGSKMSPPPTNVNGVGYPTAEVEVPTGDRAARTLGLMNVPDTVNDARIRALVEPFGKLIKIVLRPDHQGAIVEYADVHNAGKASLGLEGQEIIPGRKLHVGTVSEMLKQSAEKKVDRVQQSNKPKKENAPSTSLATTAPGFFPLGGPIKRPQQPGTRGRRGGLGMKRGGIAPATQPRGVSSSIDGNEGAATKAAATTTNKETDHDDKNENKRKKSNADFRVLIERNRAE